MILPCLSEGTERHMPTCPQMLHTVIDSTGPRVFVA